MNQGDNMDDRYAINLAKAELREAYRNADVDGVMSRFADSFTDMRDGQTSFGSPDSRVVLRATLEKLFLENDVELTPIVADISVCGDIAVEYGWHELTRRPKAGGGAEQRRTRYVEVWRRGAQGAWQITFFMDNADQKPLLAEQH